MQVLKIEIKRRKPGLRIDEGRVAREAWLVLRNSDIVGSSVASAIRGDTDLPGDGPTAADLIEVVETLGASSNAVVVTQLCEVAGRSLWDRACTKHGLTVAINRGFSAAQRARSFDWKLGFALPMPAEEEPEVTPRVPRRKPRGRQQSASPAK